MRAIAGTGIEETAGGAAQQGVQIDAPETKRVAKQFECQPENQGSQQSPDGDKNQRMSKLAVVFQSEQRVGRGANQRIGIRQLRGKEPHHRGGAYFIFPAARLGKCSAQQPMSQDVHQVKVKYYDNKLTN